MMGSQGLEIQDIQAISDLKTKISTFSQGIQSGLKAANTEVDRTFEWLRERTNYWQREVERAQYLLSRAQADLIRCQNSGYYDVDGHYHQPYCGCEERAVEQARMYLQQCNEALQIARSWTSRVDQAASDHIIAANQLTRIADWHSERAQINLDKTIMKYEAAQSSASQVGSFSDLLTGAVGGIIAGIASQNTNDQEWVDREIQIINVNDLPVPEGVDSDEDFKKVPMEDVRAGIQRWQEMRYIIDKGIDNNSDYWAKLDQESGLEYSNGYQKIYDAFYGSDAIRVEKDGNDFSIINGRHRIWMAKQMGITQLPVHLFEKI